MSSRIASIVQALGLLACALTASPVHGQCDSVVPRPEVRSFEDLYQNLQSIQCAYALDPQPRPAVVGSLHVTTRHGPLEAMLKPAGELQPDGSHVVTVFGTKRIIAITQDRSDGDVAGYEFQVEITEVRNIDGVVFSKQNLWDNYPRLAIESTGNVLMSLYDVGDATYVSGIIRASTLGSPGNPSQRAMDGRFAVGIRQGCVGVFTIPVLPVSLLYAPPPGEHGGNTLTYQARQSASTTVRTTLSTAASRTVPGTYDPGFNTLKTGLGFLQSAAKAIPGYGTVISGCLKFVNEGLGSQTMTTESGRLTATSEGQATTLSQSTRTVVGGPYPQGPFQGTVAVPGLDDKVAVLLDVPLGWVPDGADGVRLIPMGPARSGATFPMRVLLHDLPILEAREPRPESTGSTAPPDGSPTAGDPEFGTPPPAGPKRAVLGRAVREAMVRLPGLSAPQDTLLTSLDLVTVRSLLALDPLVPLPGRPGAASVLEQDPRYRATPFAVVDGQSGMWEWTLNAWDQAAELELEFQCTSTRAEETADFTTTIRDDKPGMLGQFLGIGPQERQTLKSTSTLGTREETAGTTVRKVTLRVEPPSEGAVVLRAYEDLVFGTYVFHEVGSSYLQAEGVATDHSGAPAARQWVTVSSGDRTYACRTDAQGRYAIYASSPRVGAAQVRLGDRVLEREARSGRAPVPATAPPVRLPPKRVRGNG